LYGARAGPQRNHLICSDPEPEPKGLRFTGIYLAKQELYEMYLSRFKSIPKNHMQSLIFPEAGISVNLGHPQIRPFKIDAQFPWQNSIPFSDRDRSLKQVCT
jgi:hypothetical protein